MKKIENMTKAELLNYIQEHTVTRKENERLRKAMENHKSAANKARADLEAEKKRGTVLENTIRQMEEQQETVRKELEKEANKLIAQRTSSTSMLESELNYTSSNLVKTIEMLNAIQEYSNVQQKTINETINIFKKQYVSIEETNE